MSIYRQIDKSTACCFVPQIRYSKKFQEDLIENKYNAGSIVWARANGYPWWPAIVDDCPDFLRYYELRKTSIIPVSNLCVVSCAYTPRLPNISPNVKTKRYVSSDRYVDMSIHRFVMSEMINDWFQIRYHVTFLNQHLHHVWLSCKRIKPFVKYDRHELVKKKVFRSFDRKTAFISIHLSSYLERARRSKGTRYPRSLWSSLSVPFSLLLTSPVHNTYLVIVIVDVPTDGIPRSRS